VTLTGTHPLFTTVPFLAVRISHY